MSDNTTEQENEISDQWEGSWFIHFCDTNFPKDWIFLIFFSFTSCK
jgi:hypothetical protein